MIDLCRTILYIQSKRSNHICSNEKQTEQAFTEADLVDVCFTGGVYGFLQFGCVDFDVLAESLAGLSQVEAGFWRPVNDHQLPGLHLINNLLDGVAIGATFVIYVSYPRSVEEGSQDKAFLSNIV